MKKIGKSVVRAKEGEGAKKGGDKKLIFIRRAVPTSEELVHREGRGRKVVPLTFYIDVTEKKTQRRRGENKEKETGGEQEKIT